MIKTYKQKTPFAQRCNHYQENKKKYPGKIFLVVDRQANSKLSMAESIKLFCDPTQEIFAIKLIVFKQIHKRIEASQKKDLQSSPLYLYCNDKIITQGGNMAELLAKYQDKDGYLYLQYSDMETF